MLIAISLLLAACTQAAESPATPAPPMPTATTSSTTVVVPTTAAPEPESVDGVWYLVSVTASLPAALSQNLEAIDGVAAATTARVGTLDLVRSVDGYGAVVDALSDDYTIPLEAQTFHPQGRSGFVPPAVERSLRDLRPGEVVLSESSSHVRRLGVGGILTLGDGRTLSVVGVVADEWVGDAEVVVSNEDAALLGVSNERYSIVLYKGAIEDLERDANALVDADVRVRSRDNVDMFRHADAVASQLAVKVRYGEFSYRPAGGGAIEIDPAWVASNILHEHIPLLGGITCHRDYVAMLREVMTTLEVQGHTDVIDRSAYKGCWNPRFIRGRADLSHHAWGVAADINFGNDLDGPGSPTDPRLIEAMAALGILSGHTWTDPGPGHFEWFPTKE